MIQYATLTWPEVEKLPRNLPLLIPLGRDEYDYAANSAAIAAAMAAELRARNSRDGTKLRASAALLPAIPYGFQRTDGDPSGQLHVRPGLLRRVLLGVQRELKAQGFK